MKLVLYVVCRMRHTVIIVFGVVSEISGKSCIPPTMVLFVQGQGEKRRFLANLQNLIIKCIRFVQAINMKVDEGSFGVET
jgi:hypothetical protein